MRRAKSTPDPIPGSQWEDISGFDPTKEQYIRPDAEAWLRYHKIREKGAERGRNNQPDPDEQQPDEAYYQIHRWVNGLALRCKRDVSQHMADLKEEINQIEDAGGLLITKQKVTEIETKITTELKKRSDAGLNEVHELRKAVDEETADYEAFRKKANLTRMATNEAKWKTVVPIMVFGVMESGANASLLAGVTPTGLIGAVGTMVLISLLNLSGGALVVGPAMRWRNRVEYAWKTAGWLAAAAGIVAFGVFNLAVGHMRDSKLELREKLSEDPTQWISRDAVERLMDSPFGFDSFFSAN